MSKLSTAKLKVVFFVLTVALFVIGSGAPEASGGVIMNARWFIGF